MGDDDLLGRLFGGRVSEQQRRDMVTWWCEFMAAERAADLAGLPDDPEFHAAVMGYAEWGRRLAVHNS